MQIVYARQIKLDERTDVREEIGAAYEYDLEELNDTLASGEARLVPGLLGWGRATHTLICDDGTSYHVAFESENSE